MNIAWNGRRTGYFVSFMVAVVTTSLASTSAIAQLILNEAKTSDEDRYLQASFSETEGVLLPYEGYDYGVVPFSGNNNRPDAAVDPGNPFPEDLDFSSPGNQTTLPNGWNGTTGWARVLGNGGDWFELVVTEDHTDLRGYTLYWENNETGAVGATPEDRGFVKLTQDKVWADLRAGTIITLSEDDHVDEIRDDYPYWFPYDGTDEDLLDDTGHDYDLSTDAGFNPFTGSDWHVHFHVDEDVTKGDPPNSIPPAATQYFEALSDVKGHNRNWGLRIFNATNTALADQVETSVPRTSLDLATGAVQGFIGEASPLWGENVPNSGGVNSNEMVTLRADPATGASNADFEDMDWSTFGSPNVFNLYLVSPPDQQDDTKLGGVQDFSALRNPVLDNTYDWSASGTANFGTAGNWQKAGGGAPAATGPQAAWTARLNNAEGGAKVAQVAANTIVAFAAVTADGGSMTLDVQSGATLTVQNGPIEPGRVLVMDGGVLKVSGGVTANKVESFAGGTVLGSGTITGNLTNSGGAVAPGASVGTLTVTGNYVQSAAPASASLGGDYNSDNSVNAADYAVWRDNLGPGLLANEGQGVSPGQVDGDDFDYWKQHFGDSGFVSDLVIEIGGTGAGQFDTLAVGGTATLAGSLDISLINGFSPEFDDTFTVLTASSVTASLTLTGDQAENFDLIVNSTSLVLHYLLAPEGGGALSNVPEPASWALTTMALAVFAVRRRSR